MSVYDRDDYYTNSYNRNGPPVPPPHQVGSPAMSPYDNMHDVTATTLGNKQAPPVYPPSPFDHRTDMGDRRVSDDYYNGGGGGVNNNMMGWQNNPRGSMSDMKLTGHYDSDDEDMGPLPRERRKPTCLDRVCCGCCTCLPRWMRYICCILLLLIIALGITIGVMAAVLKVPDVSVNGLVGEPQASMSGSTVAMNFTLDISVDNPNGISITFEKIVAEAFYPGHHEQSIGGGELDNVKIDKNGVTDIQFPFNIEVDSSDDSSKAVVADLLSKCGLTGSQTQQLTIDYEVTPTVRVAGIPISPKISNSAKFDCPVSGLSALTGGGLGDVIPSGVLPGA
ncbi:hypothetical protein BJV82DRAFT_606279 [Fennellomyces sp. T-0311]|nr:hypothetical protein BJV82DRAFT_606279 [Fennellomyces sp. T-0311]